MSDISVVINQTLTLDPIIDSEKTDKKTTQIPRWINQTQTVGEGSATFYNKQVTQVSYTYRATNAEKNSIDAILKDHSLIQLIDIIHGITGLTYSFWIKKLHAEWREDNWSKPWEIKITCLGPFNI